MTNWAQIFTGSLFMLMMGYTKWEHSSLTITSSVQCLKMWTDGSNVQLLNNSFKAIFTFYKIDSSSSVKPSTDFQLHLALKRLFLSPSNPRHHPCAFPICDEVAIQDPTQDSVYHNTLHPFIVNGQWHRRETTWAKMSCESTRVYGLCMGKHFRWYKYRSMLTHQGCYTVRCFLRQSFFLFAIPWGQDPLRVQQDLLREPFEEAAMSNSHGNVGSLNEI